MCEGAKVVAIERSSVRNTSSPKDHGENRGKGGPHNKYGCELSRPRAIEALHHGGDYVGARVGLCGLVKLTPGQHTQNADVHHDVNDSDEKNRQKDRARKISSR